MSHVPIELRGAVTGFIVDLCKGLIDDPRWDWDVEKCDWQGYQAGFSDPTILRTTVSVFLNTLATDEANKVTNYRDARFRAFQYFRALADPSYSWDSVQPAFQPHEIDEPEEPTYVV